MGGSAALRAEVERLLALGCPGVVLHVADATAEVTEVGGRYDGPGGRPLVAGDPLRIASVSKTVTALVVLGLQERGALDIDAPVEAALPGDLVTRWSEVTGHGPVGTVSLRQLLGHTSGLRDYFVSSALARAVEEGPERTWEPAELVELGLADGPPLFPPGERWSYGDTGFVVAGIAVEHVTGRPLHDVYRELVLDPLGMSSTWLEHREDPRTGPPALAVYTGDDGDERPVGVPETRPDWAGGGLVSTASDLARLVRGVHDGSLLGPGAYEAMTAWRDVDDPRYDAYGLGLGRTDVGGVSLLGHTGAWGAFAYAYPPCGLVVTGTVNRFGVDRRPVLEAVVTALT